MAIANPSTPALHVAYVSPTVASTSDLIEIWVPAAANARAISRIPRATAIATSTAKNTRA